MTETIKSTAFTVGQSSLIFAATSAFSYCIAILQLPNKLSIWISGLTTNVYIIMFLMNPRYDDHRLLYGYDSGGNHYGTNLPAIGGELRI